MRKIKKRSPSWALRPMGRRWSPFPKALSQTPDFTLRDHGYRATDIARCACLRPSGEAGTKLYCLVTEAHVCEQLA